METKPAVSVIIPTYNYAHFICEAIDSVWASDFPLDEIEIIVIDDGSTDDTASRIKVYGDKVKYIAQENQGKAQATKVGIDHAKGKYIFNLDADDLFLPNKLREVVNIFETDKEIVHVAHPAFCWYFDSEGNEIKKAEKIPPELLGHKIDGQELLLYFYKRGILFGGGSTFAARAKVLKQIHIPQEVDMYIDEFLALATLNRGPSFFLKEALSVWRIHGKNFSLDRGKANEKIVLYRKIASLEGMADNLSRIDIKGKIKTLFLLKNQVFILFVQEKLGAKSYNDLLKLGNCIFTTFSEFGLESFEIVKNYGAINRSVPGPVLGVLKRLLRK